MDLVTVEELGQEATDALKGLECLLLKLLKLNLTEDKNMGPE